MRAISVVGILALTLLCPTVLHASSVQVTVSGTEQYSLSGTFDVGTATITVSGYAKLVQYGRYSNDASVASAIAAAFSLDCHSPVIARAKGAVITFSSRDSIGEPSNLAASLTWDSAYFSAASFAFNFPPSSIVTAAINCSPNVINSGENVSCVVSGLPNQTSSVVTFNVAGTAWSSAQPAGGEAVTNSVVTEGTPATYSIGFNYPGDANNPPASGQTSVVVNSSGTAPSGSFVYGFAIAQGGHLGVAPSGSTSGYDPVGNVTAYTDSVNGDWQLAYDSLNRLTSSQSQPTNASAQFGCWMYDSFGNMLTQGVSGAAFQTGCQAQPGVVTLQNSFAYTVANQISSAVWHDAQKNTHSGTPGYDGSGNLTNDQNSQYLYDAEGHVCAVQGLSNGQAQGTITGYLYDAEGSRVAKGTLNAFSCDPLAMTQFTSIYILGPNGETMTEVDRNLNLVRTDVVAAGQLLADYTPTGVHYPIGDWLGTKRMQVSGSGAWQSQLTVEDTYASLPYGDGLIETAPALDASTKFFTGKERDTESGLDNFGARYYSSSMGRFVSPDPFNIITRARDQEHFDTYLGQPQNWNMYAYTWNNPLRYTDPTGETVYVVTYTKGNEDGDEDFRKAAETRANDIRNGKGYDASKDTVLVAGVSSLKDFQNVIGQANGLEKQFGKVGEVDLFSHAGGVDGPNFNYGHNRPGGPHYSNEQNMAGLLGTNINWASNGQAGFYGCNTACATRGASNFAQQFANSQHVSTYGFSTAANFSSSPNSIHLFDYFHIGDKEYMVHHSGDPAVRRDPK